MNRGLCRFVSGGLKFGVVIMTVHMECKSLANLTEGKTAEETYLIGVCSEGLSFLHVIQTFMQDNGFKSKVLTYSFPLSDS
jgi:hypothetical protein